MSIVKYDGTYEDGSLNILDLVYNREYYFHEILNESQLYNLIIPPFTLSNNSSLKFSVIFNKEINIDKLYTSDLIQQKTIMNEPYFENGNGKNLAYRRQNFTIINYDNKITIFTSVDKYFN